MLHLARRFFGTVFAEPLRPAEQRLVARLLTDAQARLFWAQADADQRHAFATMRRAAIASDAPELLRAALLHDVGKAGIRLGPVGRSVATALDAAGIALPSAMALYRAHGARGAEMLATAGAGSLAVDFARRHPDPDPGEQDPTAWTILLDADDI